MLLNCVQHKFAEATFAAIQDGRGLRMDFKRVVQPSIPARVAWKAAVSVRWI
jgi:hypothetical protein